MNVFGFLKDNSLNLVIITALLMCVVFSLSLPLLIDEDKKNKSLNGMSELLLSLIIAGVINIGAIFIL